MLGVFSALCGVLLFSMIMLLLWNLIVVFSIPSTELVPKLAVFYEDTTLSLDGVLMLTRSQDKLLRSQGKLLRLKFRGESSNTCRAI